MTILVGLKEKIPKQQAIHLSYCLRRRMGERIGRLCHLCPMEGRHMGERRLGLLTSELVRRD